MDLFFYLIIATAGYFSTFNATNTVVSTRKPLDGSDKDYAMIFGALGVCLIMVVSQPVNYHPWRHQVFLYAFGRDTFSDKENWIISCSFYFFCTVVAIFFPKIKDVLSILGGLTCATLSYLIPMIAYVRTSDEPKSSCKNLLPIVVFGTLTLIGYISVTITVYLVLVGEHHIGHRPDLIGV